MEKRDEYKRKLEAQLAEWTARLEELKGRSEKLGAEARAEMERRIKELRSRRGEVQEKLDAFRDGGEEAWGHLRSGLEKAMEELKTGVAEAVSSFRSRSAGEGGGGEDETAEPEVCVRAEVPEHARFDDDNMPCDDGREGKI
jgi:DNA repair exonuclease SbcCD ATPase subunit